MNKSTAAEMDVKIERFKQTGYFPNPKIQSGKGGGKGKGKGERAGGDGFSSLSSGSPPSSSLI